ncbi:MAG: inositol monophosphatase [Verrucomicrobiota bacterium]
MGTTTKEDFRRLLCQLGQLTREAVVAARADATRNLAAVAHETAADTIYEIDAAVEPQLLAWLSDHWPEEEPVRLVMEGIEERTLFPSQAAAAKWVLIIDPIDGTRGLMYDLRPAWFLAALAPEKGEAQTRLSHLEVAVMTELPTTRQYLADTLSGIRGQGVLAERENLLTGKTKPFTPRPSTATDFLGGFSWFARFFPEAKARLAEIEETFWDAIHPRTPAIPRNRPIFEDQYISCGGYLYELLTGKYRMVADLRPLAYQATGFTQGLPCHAYDLCTILLFQELGGIIEHPLGGPCDQLLDTTSGLVCVAYGNETLASRARGPLKTAIQQHLP